MQKSLSINSVRDTSLWKHLESGFTESPEKEVATELAIRVADLCEQAADRIKLFPYYHPQFTLHDQTHLLRVCELMAKVVGGALPALNPIEVALLILSAHYHDQGMVPDATEWKRLQASPDFSLSWQRWEIEHPSIRDLRHQLSDRALNDAQRDHVQKKLSEMQEAHRTNFLRETHGERSADIVIRLIGAKEQLVIGGTNLAATLARLCTSHVWPAEQLTDQNSFHVDQSIGNFAVNLRYLALVLRLADILDFDGDRTPRALLNTIHFSSSVSLLEWSKHLSVEGWEINPKRIRFTMQCEHPAYQRAALEFMDAIDHELRQSHRIVQDFPRGTPSQYQLDLPISVERDRIEPKDNSYRYLDLEFSLSRDEIVKLLMTDKLYQSNSLFVRELLQNALDALRFRRAAYGKGSPNWDGGHVLMEHSVTPNGYQLVRCVDNGIGMDEDTIRRFLTKVGRSYYRSPEFELQRVAFRKNGVDFDPCARFGIGFMSCFMFGDQIRVHTRRDYGPEKGYGDPLEVEINGVSGLLVIRDGPKDQPVGTTVEIIGQRLPAFLDDWADTVRLCSVVEGYALATEFPIAARVTIDEIAKEINIPTDVAIRKTFVEEAGIKSARTIEQSFEEIDKRLRGSIRIGVLVNEHGVPTLGNTEAKWTLKEKTPGDSTSHEIVLVASDLSHTYHGFREDSSTCCDGILICGDAGRSDRDYLLGGWGNSLHLGDPFLVDIRGELKPSLTPARTPPERLHRPTGDHSWQRIQTLIDKAHAKAWEEITRYLGNGLDIEAFWKLTLLHAIPTRVLNGELLWEKVAIPAVSADGTVSWNLLSNIEYVRLVAQGEGNHRTVSFVLPNGSTIRFSDDLRAWYPGGRGPAEQELIGIVMRFAALRLQDSEARLVLRKPLTPNTPTRDRGLGGPFEYRWSIPFEGELSDALSAETEKDIVNRSHALVEFVSSFDDVDYENLDDFQRFCAAALYLLSDRESLKGIAASTETHGRSFRRLGVLYKAIDWSGNDAKLGPPYKIWTAGSGIFEITQQHLLAWADLPTK